MINAVIFQKVFFLAGCFVINAGKDYAFPPEMRMLGSEI
jgi:hypothetical protein